MKSFHRILEIYRTPEFHRPRPNDCAIYLTCEQIAATPKQLAFLRRIDAVIEPNMTKKQASRIIGSYLAVMKRQSRLT